MDNLKLFRATLHSNNKGVEPTILFFPLEAIKYLAEIPQEAYSGKHQVFLKEEFKPPMLLT